VLGSFAVAWSVVTLLHTVRDTASMESEGRSGLGARGSRAGCDRPWGRPLCHVGACPRGRLSRSPSERSQWSAYRRGPGNVARSALGPT
jgi:hypothetical protein